MGIYRGAGGSGDAVNDASSEALITIQARDAALAAQAAAEAAQTAAELAETNAETAETNAETAETNAETAATNAASSASAASTSASNAATSATNAANSATAAQTAETNAETAETNAAASASAASTSASNAATSATNASNSASAAATSATNASNSASAAATSATNAANSATAAQTAQTAAELAETNAETAEANAETAETNAAASASAAATSESNASTSASNAATSATNASNSASAAATSATNASNSASAAATSASNAATSESNAATSASNAAASYDSFDDRYLGAKSSAPTLDNDGNALLTGALYFNTTTNEMKVWSGSAWLNAYASLSGALLATNNLSDLNNTATARTNLGVAIGTDVQAYDADTAKLDVAQSWSAAQSFNAGVTLGDASGDALTINSSAASIPNGLNFDSNTLVIDAANNRVGIGTASPSYALQVETPTATGNTVGYFRQGSGAVALINATTDLVGFGNGATAGETRIFADGGSGFVTLRTNSTERMRITSTGAVAINTTDTTITGGAIGSSSQFVVSGTVGRVQISNTGNEIAFSRNSANYISANAGSSAGLITGAQSYLRFDTGTTLTERMRIDSSGNVGIGTSSPAYKLHVSNYMGLGTQASAGSGAGISIIPSSTLTNWFVGANYNISGAFEITPSTAGGGSTFSTPSFLINSSGNVGIGTSSPNTKLHIVGATSNGAASSIFQGTQAGTGAGTGTSIRLGYSIATAGYSEIIGAYANPGTYLTFATAPDNSTNATERMRIDSSGNVGIGTSSPSFRLDTVTTGTAIARFQGVANGYVDITDGTGTFRTQMLSNEPFLTSIGAYAMRFGTNNTERMRIDSSGNVAIGATSAIFGSRFGVKSSSNALAAFVDSTAAGAAYYINTNGSGQINHYATWSNSGVNAYHAWWVTTSGASQTQAMTLDVNGNVGIGTTSPSNRLSVVTASGSDGFISVSSPTTDTAGVSINGGTSSNKGAIVRFQKDASTKWTMGTDSAIIGSTSDNFHLYGGGANSILFSTNATERMRITSGGAVLIGQTANALNTVGHIFSAAGVAYHIASGAAPLNINRLTSDGNLVEFYQDTTLEGNISVSGTTVSYNGGHLSRWSQLPSNQKDNTLLKGTVMSNLDDMCVWTKDGEVLPNEQLNKMKVSDVEGDTNVAGVFVNWTFDEQCQSDDMNVAMTGDMIIRIAKGVVVQKGDLLMSAGDGTAKPQGDDIVRSKTVAKVTSNHVTCTYADGSYCVPCVLMAC